MPTPVTLSRREAASRLIAWTGLDRPRRGTVAETVLSLGTVQLDPMQVVAPAHLWTLSLRRGPTRLGALDRALRDGLVLEAVSIVRCLVHRDDLPAMVLGWRRRRANNWIQRYGVEDAAREVMRVAEQGRPFLSRDLDSGYRVSGFWDAEDERRTKATSVAVDLLWSQGHLAVAGRSGGQKLYRLMDAHLPEAGRLIATLSEDEARWAAVRHHLRSHGLTDGRALGWGAAGRDQGRWVQEAVDHGVAVAVRVAEAPSFRGLADPAWFQGDAGTPRRALVLAPVDTLVAPRPRLEAVFGFRYRWDAYTPRGARRGGAYNMPILYGSRFWGEADARWEGDRLSAELRPAGDVDDPPPGVLRALGAADALCRRLRG